MSIKYLQDQQLNQVQQSPNNSPWAKLIAQSEMLERNKMRQPQGQAPQGTVAGNIQQQLMAAQQQESEKQNADLYKSQMLAQLIGSGQIPANFSAQGYADGGLTQPQAGTGAYRGIMMPSQGAGANPSYAPKQPTLSYVPPSSQDPAAQEKKHGMLQTLLDNSMYSGKGTIDSNMQMYSDMLTGKLFGRGFAEGGDIRGFVEGGSLFGYDPNLNSSGLDPRLLEAQDAENAARLRATEMVRKMHLGDAANKGVLSQLERDTHPMVKRLMEQEAQNAAKLKATDMGRQMQLGDVANRNAIPNVPPSMTEQMSAAAKQNPLDTMWAKMSEADRLNAMHRASVQPETAPTPSMTEGMSAAAQNPPRVDTMASQMSAADQANSAAKAEAIKAAKSSLIGKGIRSLGLGMGPSAVESMSDIIAPEDWAAKNKALDTGGMHGALGWYAGKVGEGFKQGNERIAQNMSGLGDTIKSNITQPLNEFWNGPNAGAQTNAQPDAWTGGATTPQTPPTTLPQTPQAQTPQAQTPQAQTPQQGVRKREDGVIVNSKSAGKAPDTKQNGQVTSDTHGYGTPNSVDSHPAGNPINALLTTTQATQAADKTSDTGMGQGSILDSLYSKLKDTDVDYSDLAKRISENEYDLARERKDGTFNAILGGVGAALSKAGSYEGAGDRVFRPGYGAIAGAGIMGGLKMANESGAAIAKKSQDNTMSMLALKKLKGDSLNNVLDAISAQKQNEVYARSVAQSGEHNIATAKHQAGQLVEEAKKTDILQQAANTNAARVNAEIEDLKNKMPPADAAMLTSLSKTIDDAQAKINGMDKGFVAKDDAEYLRAQTAYNNAFNALNGLYSKYGINLGAGANAPVRGPNAIKVISRERI